MWHWNLHESCKIADNNFQSFTTETMDILKNKMQSNRMHCKMVFNFALRHDIALLQDNRLLA